MRTDKRGNPYHPAKYSKEILKKLEDIIFDDAFVLDCFAGTGKIHSIPGITSWGIEIEPEWANMHPRTIVADATAMPFRDESFPYVVTSCTYGNRMADHHDAKDGSIRNTYKHSLDRELHPSNTGQMHFWPTEKKGFPYRSTHRAAYREVRRVLQRDGRFVLNVSNFIRKGEEVNVAGWHKWTLKQMGFVLIERHVVSTRRHKHGTNRDARVANEFIYVFQKSA